MTYVTYCDMSLNMWKKYNQAQKPENALKNELKPNTNIYTRHSKHVSYEGKQRRDGSLGGEGSLLRVTLSQSHARYRGKYMPLG